MPIMIKGSITVKILQGVRNWGKINFLNFSNLIYFVNLKEGWKFPLQAWPYAFIFQMISQQQTIRNFPVISI